LNRVRDLILSMFACQAMLYMLVVPFGVLFGIHGYDSEVTSELPWLLSPMIGIYWFLLSLFFLEPACANIVSSSISNLCVCLL